MTFVPYPFSLGERFSQMTLDTRRFPLGKLPEFPKQLVGTRGYKSGGDDRFHQPLVRVEFRGEGSASMYEVFSRFARFLGTGLLIRRP